MRELIEIGFAVLLLIIVFGCRQRQLNASTPLPKGYLAEEFLREAEDYLKA